jgi:hypothetical protein
MNDEWEDIRQRMLDIKSGLLRFESKLGKIALEADVTASLHPSSVNFIVAEDACQYRLINQLASFTQQTDNGYLYVTGLISKKRDESALSLNVAKAHLFVRKGKGKDCWLEEASMYENIMKTN